MTTPTHYVGIGASAGGLEAIETFFKTMPEKTGLAFIVIQHLSPDYESLMPELLARHTRMPVKRAEDGLLVEANTVYLILPKKNLQIFHGKLLFSDQDRSQGLNLPIDIFFNSLADDQEEKAIAIILSGTGSDGTRGIRTIKGNSGMVMAQEPEDAKFDGMPTSAMATGMVDFVLPADEMPGQLLSFVQHPNLARAEYSHRAAVEMDSDALTRIFAMLRKSSKVDFTHYKPSTISRRLERRMNLYQIADLQEYAQYLERAPQEVTSLYRELLIGVTNFFRDPSVFRQLADKWLPALLDRAEDREVRFWCPGCSTGEEPYTLGILASEYMRIHDCKLKVKIFATDVDEEAIALAASGTYPETIIADVGRELLNRYFVHRESQHYQVKRELREMVVFARHNLIKDPPFTNIELVSCRNLLIYLEPVLQQRILDMFNFALNPEGLLVLGSSENIGEHVNYFDILDIKNKLFRSRGNRKPPSFSTGISVATSQDTRIKPMPRGHYVPGHHNEEERLLERFVHLLSDTYAPPALIVNEQKALLHTSGGGAEYLRMRDGRVTTDITQMLPKEIGIALATGLQKVFKTQAEIRYSNVRIANGDGDLAITLRIQPLPGKKNQPPLAAIFFEQAKSISADNEKEPQSYDLGAEAEQRITDLEQELQFTRENLQATVEELETSNEELQATNEELLASNEELQSTNEELQSVNEELHTVNAEHQRKIIELTELTNDLDNLFSATRLATLFLDENLEIRRFTQETVGLFSILEKDIGRAFADLNHGIRHADPNAEAAKVLQDGKTREYEVQMTNGHWYQMRITPYNVGTGHFVGVVITFMDIDQAKKEREQSRLFFEFAEVFMVMIGPDQTIQRINRKGCETLGYPREALLGQNWFDIALPRTEQSAVRQVFNDCIQGNLQRHEFVRGKIRDHEGREIAIAWRNTVLRDDDGRVLGTLSSGRLEEDAAA